MTRRFVIMAAACTFAVVQTGCATPPSQLYTLSPSAAAATTPEATSSKLGVAVGVVTIPALVDRPQIVVRTGANQVSANEFNRWASPLQYNIGQVVAADLGSILGRSAVSSIIALDADYHVTIDVQTFETMPGDAASLGAVWIVRRTKDGATETGRVDIREASSQPGYAEIVAAHSRALGRMSKIVAGAILELDSAAPQ